VTVTTTVPATVTSVDYLNNVPILPDPGTETSLFDLGQGQSIEYVDANLDGNAELSDGTNERKHPVLFAAGTTPRVSVVFTFEHPATGSYQIRGRGPDQFEFVGSGAAIGNLMAVENLIANKQVGPQINRYTDFAITWTIKKISGEDSAAGISHHPLYVSAAEHRTAAMFLTVVDVAVRYNTGRTASQESSIIAGSWNYFAPKNAVRIDDTAEDRKLLKYWGAGPETWFRPIQVFGLGTPPNYDTASLLEDLDGRCEAWASFFLDVLAVNGVVADAALGEGLTIVRPLSYQVGRGFLSKEHFLIHNAIFQGVGQSGDPQSPYLRDGRISDDPFGVVGIDFSDVTRGTGLAAQNNLEPTADIFANHALVDLNGKIYDPSYGRMYDDLPEWEAQAVAGFVKNRRSVPQFNDTAGLWISGYFVRRNNPNLTEIVGMLSLDYQYLPQSSAITAPSVVVVSDGASVSKSTTFLPSVDRVGNPADSLLRSDLRSGLITRARASIVNAAVVRPYQLQLTHTSSKDGMIDSAFEQSVHHWYGESELKTKPARVSSRADKILADFEILECVIESVFTIAKRNDV